MAHYFPDVLTPASRLRYAWWRMSRSAQPITVSLGAGGRIIMRPEPARDFGVAYDIFFRALYGWPDGEPQALMSRVVDVGANVGYTIVDWARRFPASRIEAFEPHPRHLALIKAHVALNAISDRVTVHESAAGCAPRDAFLVDAESRAFVDGPPTIGGPGSLSIHVSDFFETVAPGPIDLLKLDADGAEYSLLSDPRFGDLDLRALALEWHQRPDRRDGGEWCRERLARLGYRTVILSRDAAEDGGLLWAFPTSRPL